MPRSLILLVEDDEDLAACLQAVLEEDRYEVASARDGRTALERCRRPPSPILVLVDLNLPGEPSGRPLIQALRACLPAQTRLVLVSAVRDLARRANELGADAFLEKPFGIDDLLRLVENQASEGPHPSSL